MSSLVFPIYVLRISRGFLFPELTTVSFSLKYSIGLVSGFISRLLALLKAFHTTVYLSSSVFVGRVSRDFFGSLPNVRRVL